MFPSNRDIEIAMNNQICYKSQELIGGNILKNGNKIIHYTGGYSSVFPFINKNKKKVAVRCWNAPLNNVKKRTETISKHLIALNAPYFVTTNFIDDAILINGTLYPVVIMDWVEGETLKDYIDLNINDKRKMLALANNFYDMVLFFHKNQISHGDFQHGNIMVLNDGKIVVIDYDSMYVSGLDGLPDCIKGKIQYQHPSRKTNALINSKLDYFSELIIYLSLLVYANDITLWDKETEWLLFTEEDFESPNTSLVIKKLLKNSNPQIVHLTKQVIDNLTKNDIELLLPLEDLLLNRNSSIINEIAAKF